MYVSKSSFMTIISACMISPYVCQDNVFHFTDPYQLSLPQTSGYGLQLDADWDIDNLDSIYQTGLPFSIGYDSDSDHTAGVLVIRLVDGVNSIYECETESITAGSGQTLACDASTWMNYCSEYGEGYVTMDIQLYGTTAPENNTIRIDINTVSYAGTQHDVSFTLGTASSPHKTYVWIKLWEFSIEFGYFIDAPQKEHRSWAESELYCEYLFGTTLANFNTELETAKAKNTITTSNPIVWKVNGQWDRTAEPTTWDEAWTVRWLGMRDKYHELHWKWLNDATCSNGNGNWATFGMPKNDTTENCGTLYMSDEGTNQEWGGYNEAMCVWPYQAGYPSPFCDGMIV
eukprot:13462_1